MKLRDNEEFLLDKFFVVLNDFGVFSILTISTDYFGPPYMRHIIRIEEGTLTASGQILTFLHGTC